MFVSLRISNERKAAPQTAVDLLMECHDRIRRFTALAQSVAQGGAPKVPETVEAAGRLVAYFGKALPLHVEDEDRSLRPRLEAQGGEVDAGRLAEMTNQHEAIEALLGRLLPAWRALAGSAPDAPSPSSLVDDTERLAALMADHLALEETHVFPLATRLLTPDQDEALRAEFRARRQPG